MAKTQKKPSPKELTKISWSDWLAKGESLFGKDIIEWRFVCPGCGTVQTGIDLHTIGNVPHDKIEACLAFSCIGRFTKDRGCNWTLGALWQIHTCEIIYEDGSKRPVFEFAEV